MDISPYLHSSLMSDSEAASKITGTLCLEQIL